MKKGVNLAVLAAVLLCAACSHQARPAWTFRPPPPTLAIEPRASEQRSVPGTLHWLPASRAVMALRVMWSHAIDDPGTDSAAYAIQPIEGGIVFAAGRELEVIDTGGRVRWRRTHLGAPLAAYGSRIFATAGRGFAALDARTGKDLWRRGNCDRIWARWVVSYSQGVMFGCGHQGDGNAELTTYSSSGSIAASQIFTAGMLDGSAVQRIDSTHAWLMGGFSGAYSGSGRSIATLPTAHTTPLLRDITLAGNWNGIDFVTSQSFFGRSEVYEPVLLERLDRSTGQISGQEVYAPDAQFLANQDQGVFGQAYVAGGYVYVAVGSRLYRYTATRSPNAQHPELLMKNLSGRVVFSNGVALVFIGTRLEFQPVLIDLTKSTRQVIGPSTHFAPFEGFAVSSRNLAAWKDADGYVFLNFDDRTMHRLRGCDGFPVDAAESSAMFFVLCRARVQLS